MFKDSQLKKLPEGFAEGMASADTDELKAKILESEQHIYEIDAEKSADENLQRVKEEAKLLGSAYREAKSTESAKISYCLHVLESRGVKI